MKKLLLLSIVLLAAFQLAQAQLPYYQNFGTTGATLPGGWAFAGADASSNMSVATKSISPSYTCESGGQDIEDGGGTTAGPAACTLTTPAISTTGYSGTITLTWGAQASSSYGGVVTLGYSTNGSTYTPVTFTNIADGADGIVSVNLPAGASNVATLYLQWTFTRANTTAGLKGNYELDDVTLYAAPVTTVDESGVTQTTNGNINQGSTGNILSEFHTNDIGGNTEITQLAFPLSGASSFATGDFSNFHLWAGNTSTFSGATEIATVSGTGISSSSTLTFSSLTQSLNSCNTDVSPDTYFWITADVSATATVNDYIVIPALGNSDFTFSPATTPTNSETAGGKQTIQTLAATPTVNFSEGGTVSQVNTGTITQGTSNDTLSKFYMTSGNASGNATLGSISFTAGGTFIAGDITNFHLYSGTNTTFTSATLLSTVSGSSIGNGGTVTFSSLAQSIAPNSVGYYWITCDVSATGTINNTVNVPALANTAFNFTAGTAGTNSISVGGTQTIIAPAYYWNGGAIASDPANGGTGTWGTANSWRQPSANGAQATWADGNIAILGGTAGTITLAANVSTPNITTQTTAYVLAGSSTLNLTGSTPTLNVTTKFEIDGPVAATNQIVISNPSSTINFGSTSGTANTNSGSNTLTGGFYVPSTATGVRVNGNQPNAFGTSGNAGTILIDATGTILSCVSGVGNTLGNTVYNAISLNPSGNTPFGVAIGATKGGSAGVPSFPITYAGEISEGGSGISSIYTGNTTAAGGGGASGTIFTYSYAPSTGYIGSTVVCGSQNSYLQCGANNCFPQATDLVYGNTGSGYGIIDLNGKSVTVGALSSNMSAGTNFGITNNSGAGTGTLTLNGDGNAPGYNLFAAVIGTNSGFTDYGYIGNTAGSGALTGSNNVKLVLGSGYQDTLKLTAVNTFTGGLTIDAGEVQLGIANALPSGLNITLGGGTLATGDAYNSGGGGVTGYTSSVGTLTVSAASTITLGGVAHTLTLANISGVTATNTLTINNWSGSAGTSGTVGQIFVTSGSLSQTELNNITFAGFGAGAQLLGTNELVPYSASLNASVSVLPTTGSEAAGTPYVITVSVAPGTVTQNSTVNYILSGTNVTSSRFVGSPSLSGSVTILAGQSSASVTYTVYNDNVFEGPTTATVTISKPATGYGSIATASGSANFTIADDATFYWNGGTATGPGPSAGGSGTWDATNAWIAPINTSAGTAETWVDGLYNAEFDGTAGTVTVDNSFHATLATFNTSGYILQTNSATEDSITTGNIVLGNNVNLTVSVDNGTGSGRLDIFGVTAGGGADTIILAGSTSGNERIGLVGSSPTVAAVTKITGTGTSYIGYNTIAASTAATISGNIVNNSTEATLLGGTSTSTMNVTGVISGSAGITIQNGGSGGAGHVTLSAANLYTGSTTMNGASSAQLILNNANALPSGTALIFAASEGGILDMNGNSATISALSSASSSAGSITNNAAGNQTSTLTITQSATNTFNLAINDGANSKVAVVFNGTGTLTLGEVNSSFSGGLTISSGEIILDNPNTLSTNLPLILSGGEFKSGGNSQTFASLQLTANSTIGLGNGTPTITFGSATSWTAGAILTVNGWAGTAGTSGTAGKLIFSTSLTGGQLAQISFPGFSGATQLGTGEVVPSGTVSTFFSVGTGIAETSAIWATTINGTGVTITSLGGFTSTVNIEVQNGTTVTTATGGITAGNLTIDAGGTLNSTDVAGTPVDISVYGNLTNNGTIGSGATTQLGINFEGTSQTISGSNLDLLRIRKNTNTNVTTGLTINANVNIWQSGAAGLYNSYAGTSTFNVTVASGYTLNFEGSADLAMDGPTGTASDERKGLVTINGTITGVDTVFATTNNTGGTTGITINSGGVLSANSYVVNLLTGLSNDFQLTVNTGSTMDVNNYLGLVSGTFSPQGTVHFKSTSSTQCAVLDNFSSGFTGTYSGSAEADRAYDAASGGLANYQHFIGSPVSSPAVSQLGASGTAGYIIPTSPTSSDPCDQLQSASNSPYGNLFSYNENAPGASTCALAGWDVITSGSLTNGVGYSYLVPGTGTLTLTGQPNLTSSYTLSNLTNHGWSNTSYQGNVVTGGWWLVSNPYLASLAVSSNGTGMDNQVQVWIEDGESAGTYQASIAGEGATLAPFQAYMVHVTNPGGNTATEADPTTGSITINATDRTISQATQFYRTANQSELKIMALNTGTGLKDYTTVAFNSEATVNFDPTMDANKLGGALGRHTIYSVEADGQMMSINTLPQLGTSTVEVPVTFKPGVSGNYSFSFAGLTSFDATTTILLQDKLTNTMYNVKNGDYKFTANATDNWDRFTLIFTPVAATTGLNSVANNSDNIPVWSYENKVNVDFSQLTDVKATVTIYNILGQEIVSENYEGNNIYTRTLDNVDAAFMIVRVVNGDQIVTKKVFITNAK